MPSIADNEERNASVNDAVHALERASKIPAKQRSTKVSGVVDVICRHAFEDGLDATAVPAVAQLAAKKTELDQTSVTTLIKNLYPAQRVPSDVVVSVVGGLGQGRGKPSAGTQNELVKWLTVVYDILEDPSILSRLYGVLFGMLDMISIRTSLCHLLSRITRRKHVKPFRIQQLLELSRGLGNEPALQGLLRVYKDYYPDIILTAAGTSRKSFPPALDPEWRTRLLAIQDAGIAIEENIPEQQRSGFRLLRKGAKRSKVSAIPEVHTFQAHEATVTLEEIDSVEDFVEKLDRIEPPSQMISFLTDPLLQKFADLKPSPVSAARVELWLSACLQEEYTAAQESQETSSQLSEVLDGLCTYTQYSKVLLSIAARFLMAYLPIWDGVKDIDAVLVLLSRLPLQPFQDIHDNYLGPVERAVSSQNPAFCHKLIDCYTELLRQWTTRVTALSTVSETPTTRFPYRKDVEALVSHVSTLTTSLILSFPLDADSPCVSSAISFYETLSSATRTQLIPIVIPPPFLTYYLAQSSSGTSLSRICAVFANYKLAFERHPKPLGDFYPAVLTRMFNCCLKDIYNLVWVHKALVADESKSAAGFLATPTVRNDLNVYLQEVDNEYGIGLAFGLSHNALLAPLAASAWRTLEEHEIQKKAYDPQAILRHKGPVSQRTLDALSKNGGVTVQMVDYKVSVLDWLATRGCGGVRDLMYATVKDLKRS
ncbi:Mis6-domain-containing protein [Lophiotrema nucula]|uniref:Mis6-domain-containing protein n=1 Tax=Lophiotrema nucula TaxID=690887 RepID=A0A6A5ZJ58_9PLEO|nr:Mis6-domain-containing protein [Lophiotrema nucula]